MRFWSKCGCCCCSFLQGVESGSGEAECCSQGLVFVSACLMALRETAVSFRAGLCRCLRCIRAEINQSFCACVVMAVRLSVRRPLSLVLNWVGITPMHVANRLWRPGAPKCCHCCSNGAGNMVDGRKNLCCSLIGSLCMLLNAYSLNGPLALMLYLHHLSYCDDDSAGRVFALGANVGQVRAGTDGLFSSSMWLSD